MAKTVVPIELSSTPGIVDNSNATAITIDSSEDVTLAGHLVFADSKKVKIGAGADLTLYHDSSSSHIENQVGHFYLTNYADDSDIIFRTDDGSGGHTAYLTLDGSAGLTQFDKNTKHTDSIKADFGNSSDLQLYHDGTNSYITNAVGALKIATETSGIAVTIGHGTSEVTVADNLTVTGDLTVSGTTTTVSSTVTTVADPLMELNTGAGSNANDLGFVFERGSTGDNAALIWDESADVFAVGTTTATGTSTGNMTFTAAGFTAGAITGTTGTFSGVVDADAGVTIDNITIDGTEIDLSSGDLTIDVAGDIILDADGGDIKFQDGTTDIFSLINSSSDIQLKAAVQDKDMIFRGNDAGTIITALTLDMSDAGTAIFNNKLFLGDTASHTDDFLQIESPASGGGHGIQIRRNDSNTDQGIGRILFGNNTDTDLVQIHAKTDGANDNGALLFSTQPDSGSLTERMRIDHDGKVGIGTSSPAYNLHVEGSGTIAGLISRTGSGTNSFENALLVDVKTSNDAADGFGPALYFTFTDSGVTRSEIANISVLRDGADNSGKMRFGVRNAGTWDYDAMTISAKGQVKASSSAMVTEAPITGGTDNVTPTVNAATQQNCTLMLEGNTTIGDPSNAVAGQILIFEIKQEPTDGPWTLSWHENFVFAGGTAPTMTATDNMTDIFTFRFNGAVWQEIGRSQNIVVDHA
jgi:hypothetical protein